MFYEISLFMSTIRSGNSLEGKKILAGNEKLVGFCLPKIWQILKHFTG